MRICLVTDTWANVNGVVTTLRNTVKHLQQMGHEVKIIEPSQFRNIPAPGYPEVRLAMDIWRVGPMIQAFDPDAVHIATEGPLGFAARWYCKVDRRNIPHNTSYHTKFPEYLNTYWGIPVDWGYWLVRWFHKFSTRVLVTNETMLQELSARDFHRLAVWNRGVDRSLFTPSRRRAVCTATKPLMLCVSRASKEKGLDDFCRLELPGTKMLVGDGPYLAELKSRYPDVMFVGYQHGEALADCYANADVLVFPSKTDTFGVVMLESLASGTPVAAYPVTGPVDVIEPNVNGAMDSDLSKAVSAALCCDRLAVARSAERWDWRACTETFVANLTQIPK
jgi:glycosyltransferase involved in cell wall biosynthesis